MGIFYDRTETEDRITIVYKNMILYYIVFFGLVFLALAGLIFTYLNPGIGCFLIPFVVLPLLVFHSYMSSINSEINKAMKAGKTNVSGSRFSAEDPLTFIIEKQ
ncbi:hypothetical protein GF318_01110 [Candidatus Micrarchaeota archaeon]|nr:hypothetical protein [Candidatus Micrarchaeota archaeon]